MYQIFKIICLLFHLCSLVHSNTIHIFGDSHACFYFSPSEDFEGPTSKSFEYSLKKKKKLTFLFTGLGLKQFMVLLEALSTWNLSK
jgi:hypothetical protein